MIAQKRRGAPLRGAQKRKLWSAKLPPDAIDEIRRRAEKSGQSQADVILVALGLPVE